MNDSIEFYSDDDIKNWLAEFFKPENDEKIILPNIPFSYYELAKEIGRREHLQD